MMTIHRMMLKTHLLLTTHVRSVHSILFRSSLQTTKRRDGCAQSVPKRSETCAWKRATLRVGQVRKSLHVCHFTPLGNRPRQVAGAVWGTRGPEFKSRRPDGKPAGNGGFFVASVISRRPGIGGRGTGRRRTRSGGFSRRSGCRRSRCDALAVCGGDHRRVLPVGRLAVPP